MPATPFNRRRFLHVGAAGLASLGGAGLATRSIGADKPAGKDLTRDKKPPTKFQVACMTLVYGNMSFKRALTGIKSAGYRHVCWYMNHAESDGSKKRVTVLANDAAPEKAKELAKECRDLGLEPVMMFGPNPENVKAMKQCIAQAGAAGVAQLLTMGSTRGNDAKLWIANFKMLAPIAKDAGVTIVVKQHGGNTGTGEACAAITREVAQESIKVCYDAGNVVDYFHAKIDPLPDIKKCADEVRSFAIKDHRMFPRDQDCGPGFGEIDHYKLLAPVAFTGLNMPLCCENIFAPVIPRPTTPEGIDALARRAREYLEIVIKGLQS
jgi:sugar phosphate isomerase/epimerase